MKKLIRMTIVLFLMIGMAGCSESKEIPEEQILYRMLWDGKEIVFYEDSVLSYTDGNKNYASGFQMLDSDDGTKRLYTIEDAFGIEYKVIQDGEILEPVGTFVVKSFEGKNYEQALELVQKVGLVDESLILTDTVANVYTLDVSKPASLWFEGMIESIPRRWTLLGTDTYRGDPVKFTFEELQGFIDSWTKVNVAKNQITNRVYLVSWESVIDNQLLFQNGMEMHVPEIEIFNVMIGDQQYIEIENRLDYSNASVEYVQLTEQQMSEFQNWIDSLQSLQNKE